MMRRPHDPPLPISLTCLRSVPDALIIVCGDHFGVVVDRSPELLKRRARGSEGGGLVGLVDKAVARGDRIEAVEFLSMEASHGRIKGRGGEEVTVTEASTLSGLSLVPVCILCAINSRIGTSQYFFF